MDGGSFSFSFVLPFIEMLKPGAADLLLPEDGIVDEVAVDIAVRGQRIVRLTSRERRLVAEQMIADGAEMETIAEHLGVCRQTVWRLMKDEVA